MSLEAGDSFAATFELRKLSNKNVWGGVMYDFRLYQLDKAGHILGPPDNFSCDSDEAAIEKTKHMVDSDHDAELWQLDRLVFRLQSPDQ